MKQTIGIILVIAALAFGYFGYTKLENSRADVKIGPLEISASDKSSNNEAYVMFALAAISLVGGFVMLSKGKS